MIDRKSLLDVEISPFDQEMLELIFGVNYPVAYTIQFLYLAMILRYYERMDQKYGWDFRISLRGVLLTKEVLVTDALGDRIWEIIDTNTEIWEAVCKKFGWDSAKLYVDTIEDSQVVQRDIEGYLSLYHSDLNSDTRKLLLENPEVFEDAANMDCDAEIIVMESQELGWYLTFRETHGSEIKERFAKEDEKIMEVVPWISHPLHWQIRKNCKLEGNRYQVAFCCGISGDNRIDFHYLSPRWVIGSFVIHGLLEHAKQIFGKQEVL